MKKGTKIILGVLGGVGLLIVLALGTVAWWFNSHKDELIQQGKVLIAEGAAAGKQSSGDECVAMAMKRMRPNDGIMDQVRLQVYLKSCLKEAHGTLSYCQDAPPLNEIMKTVAWRQATADALGLASGENPIVKAIQQHCTEAAAAKP